MQQYEYFYMHFQLFFYTSINLAQLVSFFYYKPAVNIFFIKEK